MTPLSWLANFIQHRVCKTNLRINLDTTDDESVALVTALIQRMNIMQNKDPKPEI